MIEEKKIWVEDDPELLKKVMVEMLETPNGQLYQIKDEHSARYWGSTHFRCDCGEIIPRSSYKRCTACAKKYDFELFLKMPIVKYDKAALLIHDEEHNKYYRDPEEWFDEVEINDLHQGESVLDFIRRARFEECEPVELPEFNILEHLQDCWSPDSDCEVSDELKSAEDHVNKALKESPPIAWEGSGKRLDMEDIIENHIPKDWIEKLQSEVDAFDKEQLK